MAAWCKGKDMAKTITTGFFVLLLGSIGTIHLALAETIETSVPGLVIKEVACVNGSQVQFTVSNRNKTGVSGEFKITAFDNDGDPIGNAQMAYSFDGLSGDKLWTGIHCKRTKDGGRFVFEAQ
jgi:hypothetical protein